jgi:hypothetical protein
LQTRLVIDKPEKHLLGSLLSSLRLSWRNLRLKSIFLVYFHSIITCAAVFLSIMDLIDDITKGRKQEVLCMLPELGPLPLPVF